MHRVHAENGRKQGQGKGDECHDGQIFHNFVLAGGEKGIVGLAQFRQGVYERQGAVIDSKVHRGNAPKVIAEGFSKQGYSRVFQGF